MKKEILLFLMIIGTWKNCFSSNLEAIFKVNVMQGETLVTAGVNKEELRKIYELELIKNDIKLIETTSSEKEIDLYIDIFLFQHMADYPSAVLIIRTKKGIHYLDKEKIKLFGDRKQANLKIGKRMAERIPSDLNTEELIIPKMNELFQVKGGINLNRNLGASVADSYQKKYDNILNWQENESLPFMWGNFQSYFEMCISYQGIRKKIKKLGAIEIDLKIDKKGMTSIEKIDSPFALKNTEEMRLKKAVKAIPLWICEKETTLKLIVDLKK